MDEHAIDTVDFVRAMRFASVQEVPSVAEVRPWRWQMDVSRLRLYLERDARPHGNSAHDRLPIISCGTALHHARIVLAASGVRTVVRMLSDRDEPDLLAELEPVGAHETSSDELDLFAAIGQYQPGTRALTPEVLRRLRSAASAEGAHLDVSDTAFGWCAVLVTRADDQTSWLEAGKALSAVLLTATDAGVAAVAERGIGSMSGRLPGGRFGFPQVGLRIGHLAAQPAPPPPPLALW